MDKDDKDGLENYLLRAIPAKELERITDLYRKYLEKQEEERREFLSEQTREDSSLIRNIESIEKIYHDEYKRIWEFLVRKTKTEPKIGYFLPLIRIRRFTSYPNYEPDHE